LSTKVANITPTRLWWLQALPRERTPKDILAKNTSPTPCLIQWTRKRTSKEERVKAVIRNSEDKAVENNCRQPKNVGEEIDKR